MSKELLIVFLYDTEVNLREEEDPQNAVVYFHPSWVSANQRMALCGQLIGVTQFLVTGFAFPHIISLQSGKFAMKKIGRYILCVGTDRNISDGILERRSEMLYNTLMFFHGNLSAFYKDCEPSIGLDRLINAMEVYLPTILYAGNIFANSLTIRLPKSASTIFLEAAQILECLQDKNGVHGGAIFYQNKIVMSQLNTDITKQIVIMDPYRIKIPVDTFDTSFHLPTGVQLLIVYVDENDLKSLQEQKIPSISDRKTFCQEKDIEKHANLTNSSTKLFDTLKKERSKISTVLEEESEIDHTLKLSNPELGEMPDVVKDTVKTFSKNEKMIKFSDIKVQSYVVDPPEKFKKSVSYSVENLDATDTSSFGYCSFKKALNSGDLSVKTPEQGPVVKSGKNDLNSYYNTISDPVYPWFRGNGLPASKALHDDRIAFYCHDMSKVKPASTSESDEKPKEVVVQNPKRPTSIQLNLKDSGKKKSKTQNLNLNLKKDPPEIRQDRSLVPPPECNVPLTPLMSKLSMLDLTESKVAASCSKLNTPSTSRSFIASEDSSQKKDYFSDHIKIDRPSPKKPLRRKKVIEPEKKIPLKKSILFVYGYQNISLYLLLDLECGKDRDLIHFLLNTCSNSVPDLERHFQQCFESIPQTQSSGATNDSYSFIHVHSDWETLQKNGNWTTSQMEIVNSLHEDFSNDPTMTDITVRMDDYVIHGHQMGDSQIFYLQSAGPSAGLPMPSDLMGVISLKAKRRLERDHGLLIL